MLRVNGHEQPLLLMEAGCQKSVQKFLGEVSPHPAYNHQCLVKVPKEGMNSWTANPKALT